MAVENGQPQEMDLDRTDKLPILEGVLFDADVADDAVRMDRTGADRVFVASNPQRTSCARPSIDLPSLAESVRTVEERIARQNAEYEALTRSYERARDAESAASARAATLEKELAAARAALESEQIRSREFERSPLRKVRAIEAARARAEEAARESERHQAEARMLRDSLAARDATIVQVLHSLSERDAQLSALQAEHAKVLPALEARAKSSTQLEDELTTVRAQLNTASAELKSSQQQASALSAQAKRNESEINATRADLALPRPRPAPTWNCCALEIGAAIFIRIYFATWTRRSAPRMRRARRSKPSATRLQGDWQAQEATISAHSATIEQLQSAAAAQAGSVAEHAQALGRSGAAAHRVEHQALAALEAERARLQAELGEPAIRRSRGASERRRR